MQCGSRRWAPSHEVRQRRWLGETHGHRQCGRTATDQILLVRFNLFQTPCIAYSLLPRNVKKAASSSDLDLPGFETSRQKFFSMDLVPSDIRAWIETALFYSLT